MGTVIQLKVIENTNQEHIKLWQPVVCEDGRRCRIICTDARGKYPIVALLRIDGNEVAYHYKLDGTCECDLPGYDLVNIPLRN